MARCEISSHDRMLLTRVRLGDYDNETCLPIELEHLVAAGLVEANITMTLPVLPARYRYQLTVLGESLLK